MEERKEIKNLIITLVIIISVLLIFYFITVFITKKQNEKEKKIDSETNETVIDYDTILVSDIYKQNSISYYVLAVMPEDENVTSYRNALTSYSNGENALRVYEINLSSAFNKNYISETTDLTGKFPIFSKTTLLKIENGTIVENYQDNDINTFLKTLSIEE